VTEKREELSLEEIAKRVREAREKRERETELEDPAAPRERLKWKTSSPPPPKKPDGA
jgi:hypothetical protein